MISITRYFGSIPRKGTGYVKCTITLAENQDNAKAGGSWRDGHGKAKERQVGRSSGFRVVISAQERQILVAQAAYFRAEKRAFAAGGDLQDWVEAEKEVLRLTGSA